MTDRVVPLAKHWAGHHFVRHVGPDEEISKGFAALKTRGMGLRHSGARRGVATREALHRQLHPMPPPARRFAWPTIISSYSLTARGGAASLPFMQGPRVRSSPLSYLGAIRSTRATTFMGLAKAEPRGQRALPRRELGPQGIRVNAISAGPIQALRTGIRVCARCSPIWRATRPSSAMYPPWSGNAAAFLCSDSAAGISGKCCTSMADTAPWHDFPRMATG